MEPVIIEPKPGVDMGRITVDMHVENADDLSGVALGVLRPDQVRFLDVNALVDTGTNFIGLAASDVARLGLRPIRQRQARTAAGLIVQQIYSAVRVTVEGRDCLSDVVELPDGSPALLGQVPLEVMDFWIDMSNRRLAGNPEHGGQWMMDSF
jgi:predicted aspartyl protease